MAIISSLDKYQQEMLKALKQIWMAQKGKKNGYPDLDSLLLNFFDERNWSSSIQMLNELMPEESESVVLADLGVLANLCDEPEIFAWLDAKDELCPVSGN
jgi:hypothetical protein